jgi:hypothetical protein
VSGAVATEEILEGEDISGDWVATHGGHGSGEEALELPTISGEG